MMGARGLIGLPIVASMMVSGCVKVPASDGLVDVAVDEIVRRLKCELLDAVDKKRTEDPRFVFLTQWSAKVHLTLVVDDQVSVNPGATFIEPLKVAGTSRSLAIGAGLTTQAVRTEDIEFFMSFPEAFRDMSKPEKFSKTYAYCVRYPGLMLESELGLKAVIDKALAPVGAGILFSGENNPGIQGGQPKVPGNEVRSIETTLASLRAIERQRRAPLTPSELSQTAAGKRSEELEFSIQGLDKTENKTQQQLEQLQAQIEEKKKLTDNLARAKQLESDSKMLVNEVVHPLAGVASTSVAGKCLPDVDAEKFAAVASAAVVAVKKYGVDNAQDSKTSTELLNGEETAARETFSHAENMLRKIKTCGPPEKPKPALYDPLDLIGETVNFYVTGTGSITPSWRLVRLAAPLASTFLSGTRKDTNTLILAMGRPNVSASGATPSEAMNNQVLAQILSQAITARVNSQ